MAITRTQIAKQLLEQGGRAGFQGGGADMGKERGSETGRAPGPVGGGGRGRDPMAQFGKTPEEIQAVKDAAAQSDLKKTTGLGDFLGVGKVPLIQAQILNKILNKKQLTQNEINRRRMERNLRSLEEEEDLTVGGDGPSIFLPELPTQAPIIEEPKPELSVLQQMIADTPRFRFAAEGGRAAFGGGSDMGSVADSKGNVGPGTGGYQGGPQGGMGRGFGGGDGPSGPPTNVGGGEGPKFDIFNPIDSIKAQLASFAGLKPEDIAKAKSLEEDDEDEKSLQETLAGGITNQPEFQSKIDDTVSGIMTNPDLAALGTITQGKANGGRIGLMGGGMPYEGGIMDLESSRQMYGLGKLVKKVTRTVKKIAKSPIGKAALLYAGGAYLGGSTALGGAGGTFMSRLGNPSNLMNLRNIFSASKIPKSPFGGGVSNFAGDRLAFQAARSAAGSPSSGLLDMLGGKVGLGIFGASALAGLMTPKEEDEDEDQTAYRGEGLDIADIRSRPRDFLAPRFMAEGGSTEKEPVAKKVMPLIDMDGKEKDYRETGGFVDMGRMEKADDVPARLSKNEFVFTADAVRNAGEGNVDKGAEVMYNMMKNLEAGGEVSEESQGLEGARKMFQTSQRLEEVL